MRKRVHFSLAGLVLVIAALSLGGWIASAWAGIHRCRTRMNGAWNRLEYSYRHRRNLAEDLVLLEQGRDAAGPDEMKEVERILADLDAIREDGPFLPSDADRMERFLAAQNRLRSRLPGLLASDSGDGAEIRRLKRLLAGLQSEIEGDQERFRERVKAFNRSLAGLPGSWIARSGRYRPCADPPTIEASSGPLDDVSGLR